VDYRVTLNRPFVKVMPFVDFEAAPIDLTGWYGSILVTGPISQNGVGAVVCSSTSAPRVVVALGQISYETLPSDITQVGTYQYTLDATDTSGVERTYSRGLLFVDSV